MEKYIISKDGKVKCVTTIPYPEEIIKSMKKAGFKIKIIKEKEDNNVEK